MQKIICIIIIFLTVNVYSQECVKGKDLYKYYFINGIASSATSGTLATLFLNDQLHLLSDVTELHNPKNIGPGNEILPGFLTDAPIPTWGELVETFDQKKKEAISKFDKSQIVDLPTVQNMYNALDDKEYNIIFAHSQGNLYANSLCLYNDGKKKQINIGIADPASKTECGSSYVTISQDMVINGLRIITALDPKCRSRNDFLRSELHT